MTFLSVGALICVFGVGFGCGLIDFATSDESTRRFAEGAEDVANDPGLGTLIKEGSEYLIWLFGAWLAGDKALTIRRNKKSDERKAAIEAEVKKIKEKVASA